MHTHIEDGGPQTARGPCSLSEGQFQLLDPQAPRVAASRGCPQAAPRDAATALSLQLRHSRSPLHQASFPLPSPNVHSLSCQQGHSCLWGRRQGRCVCQVYANPLQSVNAHQDLPSWFGASLYCKGVGWITSQIDEAHPLPLPLVPQDLVLSKQGTKSSMNFFKCHSFPWEEQAGYGSRLGFSALQKSTIALSFLKSPHLQGDAYISVHSSGCGLHSIKRSQTEHLQTSVFREGFLPDSLRAASHLAAPACVPCHKRWHIFKSCLFNFETQPFLLWNSECI